MSENATSLLVSWPVERKKLLAIESLLCIWYRCDWFVMS